MTDEAVKVVSAKLGHRNAMRMEADIQRFRRDILFFFDASDVNAWRVAAEILVGF